MREVVEEVFSNIFAFTEDIPGVGEKLFPLLSLGNAALRSVAPTEDVIVEGKAVLQRVLDRAQGPPALQQHPCEGLVGRVGSRPPARCFGHGLRARWLMIAKCLLQKYGVVRIA